MFMLESGREQARGARHGITRSANQHLAGGGSSALCPGGEDWRLVALAPGTPACHAAPPCRQRWPVGSGGDPQPARCRACPSHRQPATHRSTGPLARRFRRTGRRGAGKPPSASALRAGSSARTSRTPRTAATAGLRPGQRRSQARSGAEAVNPIRVAVLGLIGLALLALLALLAAALVIRTRFQDDLALAAARAAQGSVLLATRCGPIE